MKKTNITTATLFRLFVKISQVIVGLIFIFSGFVKAVDPLGSNYKFIDYFDAFSMPWLEPIALPLAFVLSGLEFTIGLCLVLSIRNNLANWSALLFMIFFTPLTLWLAFSDPVHDCGCFGDAIILTNWQTFYKNVIILALIIISFRKRKEFTPWIKTSIEWILTISIAMLITLFSFYNLWHLPVMDFRPYKVGTHIPDKMIVPEGVPVDEYEQYFTLTDTVSGKQISIESKKYVKDSTYWGKTSVWKFNSSSEPVLIKKGYQPPIHDFTITSLDGAEITDAVLSDTGYYFLLVAYDLNKTNTKSQKIINTLYEQAINNGNNFICLTSSTKDFINEFKNRSEILYDFYTTDPITLKTIIRSNPGLVLLKQGTIIEKWHYNDIPEYHEIKQNYMLR